MRRLTPARGGFTLLELGVVLAVSAILAAALVPDFIEASRTRMAERVGQHVLGLHQAARAYFVRTSSMVGVPPNTWPGQNSSGSGLPTNLACRLGNNAATGQVNDAIDLLVKQGLLPSRPVHPFDREYSVSLRPAALTGTGCMLQVTTDVPTELVAGFKNTVPQSGCNEPGTPTFCDVVGPVSPAVPAPRNGFVRCCSFVPKPGVGVISGCPSPRALARKVVGGTERLTCD
jgi:prepilin-type N-terminal cleavage/methylation domain-containing protein